MPVIELGRKEVEVGLAQSTFTDAKMIEKPEMAEPKRKPGFPVF